MINLLTESPTRFRMADEEEEQAMIRNTTQFLKNFLPEWNFQKLKEHAAKRWKSMMEDAGFRPLPPINLGKEIQLREQKLPDI